MASNIKSFVADVEQWVDDTPKAVGKLHRAITLGMLADVAKETPIDTGRARLNWQVGRGTPPTQELDQQGSSTTGGDVVARESGEIQAIKPFSISWIANNVPYIGALNDGHSNQAPAGFVDAVFEKYRRQFGTD